MTALSPQGAYAVSLDTLAHAALHEVLHPGELVVDATAGNGYDTVFLARAVGPQGEVWAFDVQAAALTAARQRVERARQAGEGLAPVHYILDGHENALRHLPQGELGAVMFNLGYLPRADKRLTTQPPTTIAALKALMPRLRRGGLVSVHVYTGHAEGCAEHTAIEALVAVLPYTEWSVLHTVTDNKTVRPEHLYLLARHV